MANVYKAGKDSAYFTIEVDGGWGESAGGGTTNIQFQDFAKYVQSLEITEEMYKLATGRLVLYDPYGMFARALKHGTRISINWGYKNSLDSPVYLSKAQNPKEVSGATERRGYIMYVQNPSGSGSAEGHVEYSCNLMQLPPGFIGTSGRKVWTSGRYSDAIKEMLSSLGVQDSNQFVNIHPAFDWECSGYFPIVKDNQSVFRWLVEMAIRTRSVFRLGTDSNGALLALFSSPSAMVTSVGESFVRRIVGVGTGIGGSSTLFDYMDGIYNVLNYSWQYQVDQSNQGDSMTIVPGPNGESQIYRFQSEQQSTTVWRLDENKVKAYVKETGFKGTMQVLAAKDFQEVKHLFVQVTETTYVPPVMSGYSVSIRTIGNPLITAPNLAIMRQGFPPQLTIDPNKEGQSRIQFYISSVTHKLDGNGYFCDVKILDTMLLMQQAGR